MKKEQIVSRNPKVMNGALVFAGTRAPVESLIQHLTAGDSLNKFLDDFPTVSREQAVAYLKMSWRPLMCELLDENLPHETTMTFPLYTLRSAPIHAFNPLNPPYQGDFKIL